MQGHRHPKGHQTQQAVIDGRVSPEDFQGSQDTDAVANLGAAEHDPLSYEPLRLQAPEPIPEPLPALPAEVLPKPPFEVGPHKKVIEFTDFARCLACLRQVGRFRASFNYPYLTECYLLKKRKAQRVDRALEVEHPALEADPLVGVC
eukprot:5996057-Amphidinium_carterae.1